MRHSLDFFRGGCGARHGGQARRRANAGGDAGRERSQRHVIFLKDFSDALPRRVPSGTLPSRAANRGSPW